MWIQILFLAIFANLAQVISTDDCPLYAPRDKYLFTHNDKCYYFNLHQKLDYGDAREECYRREGTLAMVKSGEVNSFLHNTLRYNLADEIYDSDEHLWIGLNDIAKDGGFTWIDGSPLRYDNFASGEGTKSSSFILNPWKNFGDCVSMNPKSGEWYDHKCESSPLSLLFNEHRPFICEFKTKEHTTTPTTTTTTTTNPTTTSTTTTATSTTTTPQSTTTPRDKYLFTYNDKCYYFNLYPKLDYGDAREECNRRGGTLAMVKSGEVNSFLHNTLRYNLANEIYDWDEHLWIGLNDIAKDGSFTWIDGSPLRYDNFASEQGTKSSSFILNPWRIFGDCVSMNPKSGEWYDHKCESSPLSLLFNEHRPFICEFKAKEHTTTPTTTTTTTTIPTTTTTTTTIPTTTTTTTTIPTTTTTTTTIPTATSTTTTATSTTTTPRSTTTERVTKPVIPIHSTNIVIPKQTTTVPTTKPMLTTPVQQTTTGNMKTSSKITTIPGLPTKGTHFCPPLVCNKDCQMDGFVTDPITGCIQCQCNVSI